MLSNAAHSNLLTVGLLAPCLSRPLASSSGRLDIPISKAMFKRVLHRRRSLSCRSALVDCAHFQVESLIRRILDAERAHEDIHGFLISSLEHRCGRHPERRPELSHVASFRVVEADLASFDKSFLNFTWFRSHPLFCWDWRMSQ